MTSACADQVRPSRPALHLHQDQPDERLIGGTAVSGGTQPSRDSFALTFSGGGVLGGAADNLLHALGALDSNLVLLARAVYSGAHL